jgi:hypothetical protein
MITIIRDGLEIHTKRFIIQILGNYSNQFQQFKRIKLTAVEQLLDMDRSATSKKRKKINQCLNKKKKKQ